MIRVKDVNNSLWFRMFVSASVSPPLWTLSKCSPQQVFSGLHLSIRKSKQEKEVKLQDPKEGSKIHRTLTLTNVHYYLITNFIIHLVQLPTTDLINWCTDRQILEMLPDLTMVSTTLSLIRAAKMFGYPETSCSPAGYWPTPLKSEPRPRLSTPATDLQAGNFVRKIFLHISVECDFRLK